MPEIHFFLFFATDKCAPKPSHLTDVKKFKKELTKLLLAGPRKRNISFVTELFGPFKNRNKGNYKSGKRIANTKWATHHFIINFFYTFFPDFVNIGNQIFRDDWDGILHRSFLHWAFPSKTLLNPPYLTFPSAASFLTLEQFVEHCLLNLDAFCDGFAAILPVYKEYKIKKNNNTFWAKRNDLPNWLLRLYNHPRVALVLLDKKLKFLQIVQKKGKTRRQLKGKAFFHSVLVFFGFKNAHLIAKNTATAFINPTSWLSKLFALQGAFVPKTQASQALQVQHPKWIVHAHNIREKIAPCDLSLLPHKSQQGFVDESSLQEWDWSPYLIPYNPDGTPKQNQWDGKYLFKPKLHFDLKILYDYRQEWAKILLQEIDYDQKQQLLADMEEKNKKKASLHKNTFCDYCCNFGHPREFCDWVPNQRKDWDEKHKKLFEFFSVEKMMEIPSFGLNPSLRQLQKFMQDVYKAEKQFWQNFKVWSGISRKDIPFPTLCWGNLPQRIGALHKLGVSKRFLADLLTGADLQYQFDENGEQEIPLRVLMKNNFTSPADKAELLKELKKGNLMHYLVPIPKEFVYSCENCFFRVSSGKPRFIQDLSLINKKVRTPKFKLKDAIELYCTLHPLGFDCTSDVKNAYLLVGA